MVRLRILAIPPARWAGLAALLLTLGAGVAGAQTSDGVCYLVADNKGGPDGLIQVEPDGSSPVNLGGIVIAGTTSATFNIESSALDLATGTLWVYDAQNFGRVDPNTAEFTSVGAAGACPGGQQASDNDGLDFDPTTGQLLANRRDENGEDFLFSVNPNSGEPVGDCIPIDLSAVSGVMDVDDIAVDPTTGILYGVANQAGGGVDRNDVLVTIDRVTGVATPIGPFLTGAERVKDVEGLTIDGSGNMFASTGDEGTAGLNNSFFSVDKATGTSVQLADLSALGFDYETLECAVTGIDLQKTIVAGTDGNACPGVEILTVAPGTPITWCFEVTNTGGVFLSSLALDDNPLGLDISDLTPVSGSLPLAPGASATYSYTPAGGATVDFDNTASTTGNPTGGDGNDLPGLDDPEATDPASVRVVSAAISLEKTVYLGTNGNAGCAGSVEFVEGELGDPVTFCFVVTNTGTTHLRDVVVEDETYGQTFNVPGILAPGESRLLSWPSTIQGNILNTANTEGDPSNPDGSDIPGLPNPTDTDTAEVAESDDPVTPTPDINLEKTVYLGYDDGASCEGSELAEGELGDAVTFCFVITNTGATYLDDVTLVDNTYGVNQTDMVLLSGGEPLAPGESIVYYWESTIQGNIINDATTVGNPSNQDGDDLPGLPDVTDDDTAEVVEGDGPIGVYPIPTLDVWGLILLVMVLGGLAWRRMQRLPV